MIVREREVLFSAVQNGHDVCTSKEKVLSGGQVGKRAKKKKRRRRVGTKEVKGIKKKRNKDPKKRGGRRRGGEGDMRKSERQRS